MATKRKGDLIADIASELLGNAKGINLESLLETGAKKLPDLFKNTVTYPSITVTNWNALLIRFQKSVPVNITKKWVSDNLKMTQPYVEKNVMPSLVQLGLVDQNGKSTARAKALAAKDTYVPTLRKMIKETYPETLLTLTDDPKKDTVKIVNWFKKQTNAADTVAKQMANFYLFFLKEIEGGTPVPSANRPGRPARKAQPAVEKVIAKDDTAVTLQIQFSSKTVAKKSAAILKRMAEEMGGKVKIE